MKEYLVDVPVQVNIWIRAECQRKLLKALQAARPSTVFLVSDGGRNDAEKTLIDENRSLMENGIDWDCKVYKLYEDANRGIPGIIVLTHQFVWERVDRCIFLEDDVIPSISFFRYCKELLEKYENDPRINVICGMNHLGVYPDDCESDYFFSRQGSIWGYALWKRSYQEFFDYSYEKSPYVWRCLTNNAGDDKFLLKEIKRRKADTEKLHDWSTYASPTEFFIDLTLYSQNQLQIIPRKNMVSCIGASPEANSSDSLSRLPKSIRKLFFMKTYEIDFPIRHPRFVVPDKFYEAQRNRIICRNHPFLNIIRRFLRGWYVLKEGDFKYLWRKIKR
ncbi:MAG: hypothetical protein IJ859_07825 [Synergistaceae bacterium]|nr:hypothetical protein [Synergistaceae bacterium]